MVAPLRKEPHICRMCVNIRQKVTLSLHLYWKGIWNITKKKEGNIDFNLSTGFPGKEIPWTENRKPKATMNVLHIIVPRVLQKN